ncbi:piezo type mechanosensitive ion channel component isoform X7 [Rhynchophorus ferrugineus]|uniref:piezo type mechanosensitive ion channel component isoform X7 n=1 Tax=Rhynchophorus ferrugineus TaxID=354439 RepID=UPI003FCE29E9
MANYWICAALFRCLLPLLIGSCILFRPSLLSALYFLLLCYTPFAPVPTEATMSGHTGIFLKLLIVISTVTTLGQLGFQIALFAMPPYANFLKDCEFLEKLLRHAGFVRLNNISINNAFTWISPEPIMLATSVVFYVLFKKLTTVNTDPSDESATRTESERRDDEIKTRKKYLSFMVGVGRYGTLMTLCLAGVLRPSVVGGLYFLVFLSVATWWACYKQLRRGFAILMCCLLPIVFAHMSVLYAYQFQWPQELLEKNSTWARYFGLTPLRTSSCNNTDDPRTFNFEKAEWASYVNPFALYWLFYILVLESKALLQPDASVRKPSDDSDPREDTPLIKGVSPSRRYGSSKRSAIMQDSTGSVTVDGEHPEDIPLDDMGNPSDEYQPTIIENLVYFLENVLQLIIKVSYLGTNIIMMAWSITYISWITFVLLIWANLIWLVPNQRKSMLRSSPFLVFYAWFLLISAYIYSMNLTEEELPSVIQGINLSQIGFVKVSILPCNPLLVKCLYTCMFWITLRQYMQERLIERQSSALADMVAPLQLTVGAATSGVPSEPKKKETKIMDVVGGYLKKFLTKFWIWVVAITLFAVAITGQRMTGFRIVYMALFLIFILSFQLSFMAWRKMMFGFWLVVIIFSMLVLVLTYTYQFDNFPDYWKEYLHVNIEQQLDIGLEKFETKQLFVRLVTPTFFVIITVIQLHYFHKDFMELSDPKNTEVPVAENEEELNESSMQGGEVVERSDKDDPTSSCCKFELSDFDNLTFKEVLEKWLTRFQKFMNLLYIFLEIHMPRVVLLFAMLLCIYDHCALYIILVVLIPPALTLGRIVQLFTIYSSSVLVSLFLLARMLYQIKYINPDIWNVTCVSENQTDRIVNNMHWLGFDKTDQVGRSVPSLVKWNIIYILIVTLYSVILVRQYYYRVARGQRPTRAFFMFPRITRLDADKSLENMLKYLANYSYFKFGVEISFMATVAVIAIRMDMYAVFYAIWLIVLYSLKRSTLAKIWVFYVIFTAILLPIQYFMVVGLPPTLCIDYPWNREPFWIRLQDWAYLVNDKYHPNPKRLIWDFLLLFFISRQWVVFRIEARYTGQNYAGGSNDSIIHLAEDKSFVNPVPDFITYCRSYLDIAKRCILCSLFYITLAAVFLAGTNRTNLFSVGYLVGTFLFLWEGSDMYLRPVKEIIKKWNWLLGYNVIVILIKACFQLVGCVFIHEYAGECHWLMLFGIGCVRKFGNIEDIASLPSSSQCKVPREYLGLFWDGVCFGLLIMQKRLFQSYNFFHMINDTKATTILASRGAELIEEMRVKRMDEQVEDERRILEKIKIKMDRIKANQQKIQAIRSGDYYMFDELDDELDLLPEETRDEDEKSDMPTIGEVEEPTSKSVTIKEEPQPSTSKDEDISELTEPKEYTLLQKSLHWVVFLWAFVESGMVSATNFLNRYSRDYRYVLKTLGKERKTLKEKTQYDVGIRIGSNQLWQPAGSFHDLMRQSNEDSSSSSVLGMSNSLGLFLHGDAFDRRKASVLTVPEIRILAPSLERGLDSPGSSRSSVSLKPPEDEMSSDDQPPIVKLLLAIWYVIMSRSEWLCYFAIFLNQAKRATFLSLPLPLMVFFWGSLTIPRPSKTFWVTIIAYTELVVLIKCLFQMDIIPWNEDIYGNNPFFPPNIIGIQRRKNYANWDLLLLLAVFFHRMMLKSMGIWKSSKEPQEQVAAMTSEGEYNLIDGRLVPVGTNNSSLAHPVNSSASSQYSASENTNHKEKRKSTSSETEQDDEPGESDQVLSLRSVEVNQCDHIPESIKLGAAKYAEAVRVFFQQLLDPTARVAADVYTFMFLCDFINFFVLLIGYSSFGSQTSDGGFKAYLEENRVPPMFLFMLILQFMLIIVDRAIYLRRNILGKLIFQFIQVIILHIWLFILFPIITEKEFKTVIPPQVYYMVKCIYFLLSAFQIRCGYPSRILGNCLCKAYSMVNMFLFKGFMLVPFLFELRSVMDWMWTETSMGVFDWLKMEDIFSHIFLLKCSRNMEDEYPQPRGTKKGYLVKYMMGGALLAGIVGIIWFPLVFFSLGKAVGESNPPYDVTLELRIGPYDPVYQMSAQSNALFQFNERDYQNMLNQFKDNKRAEQILSNNYDAGDVVASKFSLDSAKIWSISPPDRMKMIEEVNSTKPINIRLDYKVSHKTSSSTDSGIISNNKQIILGPDTPEKPNLDRVNLLKMLQNASTVPILLQKIFPKFLKITNTGVAEPYNEILAPDYEENEDNPTMRNLTLVLLRVNNSLDDKEWWQVSEECDDYSYKHYLKDLAYEDCNSLVIYTLNDKIFPGTLSIITGGGIIGLYTTLVLVASRVLRGVFAEQVAKIMFEDLPNVDRVLQLTLDVYLVREAKEFALEEDLFAKLIFLFRSPETMIKWTRPKEEIDDDEDPEAN